ncbi:filamentous hemagglutinin N-terminal domain-containing protein [Hassallia byssoidea VB512170]|uniref:Filamentous hemagglutinin N-terminal domain-containing protein n=1 Tax=Hassallia byssoidea VB512170 TaxID=1304833 RepID=A0A846HH66_9CYAN|nr:filamentous hemagglutinin N-terminal domain-containing protein [Hassalia byssoidea]NEU76685.1 filamentous hemagglutinin N-terminal domain-containing protein [Hassalia byssoidea VB512170]
MSGSRSTHWGWFLGIAITSISSANCAIAQITPDSSLPNNSRVTTQNNISNIDRGTQAGSNLFHSFLQFSLPNSANVANFQTIPAINNVIVRVTGVGAPFISNINGTIQTSNPANFFLLNPNGIIFGSGATLNIGGAFLGTTASRLNFQDGTQFRTTDPTPLLTITAPIGLGLTQGAGNITVQSSFLSAGRTDNFSDFALVGGNVSLNNTTLRTPGGRVELGGLAAAGTVGLNVVGNNLSLSFPDAVARADVSLNNGTEVNVLAGGGGSIAVNARNLDILAGSDLLAGIGQGLGTVDSVAGDITLNATGEIKVVGENSNIANAVLPQALGKGGNLIINTQQLLMQDGAQVGTITFGAGNAGNFTLTANNVIIGSDSILSAQADRGSTGNAGDLTINTQQLLVRDGAQVSARTFGAGKGGNLTLTAKGVQLIGSDSSLSAQADRGSTGNAGDLTINTQQLLVRDGAQVSAGTFGAGNGGNFTLTADGVQLISSGSGLFANANRGSTGNAGDLTINTQQLLVQDGAQVGAGTFGAGKGGNFTLTADGVQLISSGSGLFADAQPSSTGNAGDLTINTQQLLVRDGAQISAGTFGAGKGGNLTLNTRDLEVQDGAQVSASTFGAGKGGNLTLTAEGVQVIGSDSGLFAQADRGSTGNAGDLTINTQQLLVRDGAQVSSGTFGTGNGGNLTLNTRNLQVGDGAVVTVSSTFGSGNGGNLTLTAEGVQLIGSGSGLFAVTNAGSTGNAGDLIINTQQLLVRDGAQVNAATVGVGKGGNLTLTAEGVQVIGFGSGLFASTTAGSTGNAGDLTINTQQLLVRDGAVVSAGTFGAGNGGNLTLTADGVQLIGSGSGLFAQADRGSTGNAGDLTINTRQLLVRDGAVVSVRSLGTGTAGNLIVNARSIRLDNDALVTADTRSNRIDPNREQATITLRSRDLILTRGSNITTNATGNNVIGGNININTDVLAAVESSNIKANSANSRGGRVIITTQGFILSPDSTITATGANPELNGTVEINTPDIDPTQGLTKLPASVVNTPVLVSSSCAAFADEEGSKFTVTGRGGLPPSPDDFLSSDVVWSDTRLLATTAQQHQPKTPAAKPSSKPKAIAIVPATGWVFNDKGEVTLISSVSNPTNFVSAPVTCLNR